MIEQTIQQVRTTLQKPPVAEGAHIQVASLLHDLLHKEVWEEPDFLSLDHIAKRLDISQTLFTTYSQDWRKLCDVPLEESWRNVATILLYKAFLLEKTSGVSSDRLYKRLNTIFKSLPISDEIWIKNIKEEARQLCTQQESLPKKKSVIPAKAGTHLQNRCQTQNGFPPSRERQFLSCTEVQQTLSLPKTLPFTLLFYEGPIARAYLETLHSMHLKPQNIIHLIPSIDVASKKPVGRLLPNTLRKGYADNIQKNKIHYWPKYLAKTHPELRQTILHEVNTVLDFPTEMLENAYSLKPLTEYSDNVTSLLIENLNDTYLHQYLSTHPQTTILFTGGGIVPASLLNLFQLRFIHVHPGFLPDIKGADCVLWSSLLTGHSSATSFYMSSRIDVGDIIESCWLPKIQFNIDMHRYDLKTLYRAVYGFFDPWVRAYALRKTLTLPQAELMNFTATPQNSTKGLTFYFMHDQLQKTALGKLFK